MPLELALRLQLIMYIVANNNQSTVTLKIIANVT